MEEFFIVSRRKLDGTSWDLSSLRDDYNAIEYCVQVLDIPEDHVEYATLGSEGLEVTLIDLDLDDLDEDSDWYMQLKRIANFNKAVS